MRRVAVEVAVAVLPPTGHSESREDGRTDGGREEGQPNGVTDDGRGRTVDCAEWTYVTRVEKWACLRVGWRRDKQMTRHCR